MQIHHVIAATQPSSLPLQIYSRLHNLVWPLSLLGLPNLQQAETELTGVNNDYTKRSPFKRCTTIKQPTFKLPEIPHGLQPEKPSKKQRKHQRKLLKLQNCRVLCAFLTKLALVTCLAIVCYCDLQTHPPFWRQWIVMLSSVGCLEH